MAAGEGAVVKGQVPTYEDNARWFIVQNRTSEVVPPFALMHVTDYDSANRTFLIGKPTADSQLGLMINGRVPIPAYDAAHPRRSNGKGTFDLPVVAAYSNNNPQASDPAHDEQWGSKSGEWELYKGQVGYLIEGAGADGRVIVSADNPTSNPASFGYAAEYSDGIVSGRLGPDNGRQHFGGFKILHDSMEVNYNITLFGIKLGDHYLQEPMVHGRTVGAQVTWFNEYDNNGPAWIYRWHGWGETYHPALVTSTFGADLVVEINDSDYKLPIPNSNLFGFSSNGWIVSPIGYSIGANSVTNRWLDVVWYGQTEEILGLKFVGGIYVGHAGSLPGGPPPLPSGGGTGGGGTGGKSPPAGSSSGGGIAGNTSGGGIGGKSFGGGIGGDAGGGSGVPPTGSGGIGEGGIQPGGGIGPYSGGGIPGGTIDPSPGNKRRGGGGVVYPENIQPTGSEGQVLAITGGLVTWTTPASTSSITPLFDHATDAGNTAAGETDLYSDAIAANTIAADKDKITAVYSGTIVGGVGTRRVRLYFAGLGTALIDSGALAVGLGTDNWSLTMTLIRKSSTTARAILIFTYGVAGSTTTSIISNVDDTVLTGLDWTATNVLKITGQGSNNNDIVAQLGTVQKVNAA